MQVFRIENEKGNGPYLSSQWRNEGHLIPQWNLRLRQDHDNVEHPTPFMDEVGEPDKWGYYSIYPEEYCGFSSLDDLHDWFDGWVEKLATVGYQIVMYDVDPALVRYGNRQLVFIKGDSAPVLVQ